MTKDASGPKPQQRFHLQSDKPDNEFGLVMDVPKHRYKRHAANDAHKNGLRHLSKQRPENAREQPLPTLLGRLIAKSKKSDRSAAYAHRQITSHAGSGDPEIAIGPGRHER